MITTCGVFMCIHTLSYDTYVIISTLALLYTNILVTNIYIYIL